ncbi:hypothetical protein QGQ83_00010 [Pseudomonas marginalis]|nr:hypothetical protein [Pseudomonas marginalis]WGT28262.1 hypothetical protein QGQ83_00010 [Pseudomonas marginalis]
MILERGLAGGASFFWEWERAGKAARCVRHWASFSQMDTRYAWGDDGRVTVHNADGSQEVYVHDDRARLVQQTVKPSRGVSSSVAVKRPATVPAVAEFSSMVSGETLMTGTSLCRVTVGWPVPLEFRPSGSVTVRSIFGS